MGIFKDSRICCTSCRSVVRSPCVLLRNGRARRISSERHSRPTQSTSCPTVGCNPSSARITRPCFCNRVLIRSESVMRHATRSSSRCITEVTLRCAILMPHAWSGRSHLWDTPMFPKAPLADQGDDLQATRSMWESPLSLFFWPGALRKARTGWVETLANHQCPCPEAGHHHDGAMAVIGDPQGMPTALTMLVERGQRVFLRRFGTRGSPSHLLAPASQGQLSHLRLHLPSTHVCRSAEKNRRPSAVPAR